MENMEEQQKLAELMMSNILDLGKFSYSLQEKREESLINQSGRMLTACSVTAALWSLSISKVSDAGLMVLFAGILVSFVFAVVAGWRFKARPMPSIDTSRNQKYKLLI